MIKKFHAYLLLGASVLLQVFHCSTPEMISGGNSSETVIGMLRNVDGSPAGLTVVSMYPREYDPIADYAKYQIVSDTTDDDGRYLLKVTDTLSEYTIVAKSLSAGTGVLISDVATIDDSTVVYNATLGKTGTISLLIPGAGENAYAYIPGTDLVTEIDSYAATLELGSVPAGIISRVVYKSNDNQHAARTKYSVTVAADDTTLLLMADEEWGYLKRLYLNTSSSGADIVNDVYDFPVCIRMTDDNFVFTQVNAEGEDIRFTKQDGSPLPFEIERWDSSAGFAEVWVAVDTVFGNSTSQYIVMYWGNPDANSQSNSAIVFDTSKGFEGVWHLAEENGSLVYDATGNSFNGTRYNMDESSSNTGKIGKALHFDGVDDFIVAHGTADGKLDFPAGGRYSLSLWAYADDIDSLWHGLAGKGHQQYYLQYKCFLDTAASWEFVEYQGGWNFSEDRSETTPYDKEWVYLTGVRNGEKQLLYVNGQLVKDTMLTREDEKERNTDGDFTMGCHLRVEMFPEMVARDSTYFNGIIDEVRVMSAPADPDWIKLCYMNQKAQDALVEFR